MKLAQIQYRARQAENGRYYGTIVIDYYTVWESKESFITERQAEEDAEQQYRWAMRTLLKLNRFAD